MTDQRENPLKQLSDELLRLIEKAEPQLRDVSAADSAKPIRPGGSSRQQIVWHLISEMDMYEYRRLQNADWELLVSLWAANNRYLAHVISHLPASKLNTRCCIG